MVKLDKPGDFVGRAALAERRSGQPPRRVLAGLTVGAAGFPGTVTRCSGTASPRRRHQRRPLPTLGVPIAMAYLDPGTARLAAEDTGRDPPGG